MSDALKVAVYGKGGVGKSVVATGLSACWAQRGRSVLHVGCDPKTDSAVRLMEPGPKPRTVLEVLGDDPTALSAERILNRGRLGIMCCEAGGPKPGLGCGGRGVARTLEVLEEAEIIETGGYQAVVFDVLGDVVCGGFAAPLRKGFAERVVIVTSEEPMAMYAANNISRAMEVYQPNGVVLAGLVVNLRGSEDQAEMFQAFAERLSTRVLATIPRDPAILAGERKRLTVIEASPDAPAAAALGALADTLEGLSPAEIALPTPMEDEDFYSFVEQW
jgi:nitrogenase iron protein NifH